MLAVRCCVRPLARQVPVVPLTRLFSTATTVLAEPVSQSQRSVYLATPTKEVLRKNRSSHPSASGSSGSGSGLRWPASKPPSHKPGESERSQVLRRYVSLVRSSPLILIFQHNNLTASEWTSVRRELAAAVEAVDASQAAAVVGDQQPPSALAPLIRMTVLKTSLFSQALRLVDNFHPESITAASREAVKKGARVAAALEAQLHDHYLSTAARDVVADAPDHPLKPILSGPLTVVAFPTISPAHITAVLRILAPESPKFAAPRRREQPSLYEPDAQSALQKLIFLGGRAWEWRLDSLTTEATKPQVLDPIEARQIASLGNLESLRAELLAMLGQPAAAVASTLSAASSSLWVTLESRRIDMDDSKASDEAVQA